MGLAGNHCRAGRGFGSRDCAVDIHGIVAITGKHIPAAGRKARLLIGDIGDGHFAINGDAVVIPQHDQA